MWTDDNNSWPSFDWFCAQMARQNKWAYQGLSMTARIFRIICNHKINNGKKSSKYKLRQMQICTVFVRKVHGNFSWLSLKCNYNGQTMLARNYALCEHSAAMFSLAVQFSLSSVAVTVQSRLLREVQRGKCRF